MKYVFSKAPQRQFAKRTGVPVADSCYFVNEGYIAMYSQKDKSARTLIYIIGPEETFPHLYQNASLSADEPLYYETLTQCNLSVLSVEEFKTRLYQRTQAVDDLLREVQAFNNFLLEKLVTVGKKDVTTRLLSRLLYFGQRFSEGRTRNITIPMPIIYDDIASSIGSTRETVNRIMRDLSAEGILRVENKIITIHSLSKLRKKIS